jgi:hypothetical protein
MNSKEKEFQVIDDVDRMSELMGIKASRGISTQMDREKRREKICDLLCELDGTNAMRAIVQYKAGRSRVQIQKDFGWSSERMNALIFRFKAIQRIQRDYNDNLNTGLESAHLKALDNIDEGLSLCSEMLDNHRVAKAKLENEEELKKLSKAEIAELKGSLLTLHALKTITVLNVQALDRLGFQSINKKVDEGDLKDQVAILNASM